MSEWLRALLRREFERDRKAQGASRGEGRCGVKLSAYAGRAGGGGAGGARGLSFPGVRSTPASPSVPASLERAA